LTATRNHSFPPTLFSYIPLPQNRLVIFHIALRVTDAVLLGSHVSGHL